MCLIAFRASRGRWAERCSKLARLQYIQVSVNWYLYNIFHETNRSVKLNTRLVEPKIIAKESYHIYKQHSKKIRKSRLPNLGSSKTTNQQSNQKWKYARIKQRLSSQDFKPWYTDYYIYTTQPNDDFLIMQFHPVPYLYEPTYQYFTSIKKQRSILDQFHKFKIVQLHAHFNQKENEVHLFLVPTKQVHTRCSFPSN